LLNNKIEKAKEDDGEKEPEQDKVGSDPLRLDDQQPTKAEGGGGCCG
jgi:hypothetical protein